MTLQFFGQVVGDLIAVCDVLEVRSELAQLGHKLAHLALLHIFIECQIFYFVLLDIHLLPQHGHLDLHAYALHDFSLKQFNSQIVKFKHSSNLECLGRLRSSFDRFLNLLEAIKKFEAVENFTEYERLLVA